MTVDLSQETISKLFFVAAAKMTSAALKQTNEPVLIDAAKEIDKYSKRSSDQVFKELGIDRVL